MKTPLIVFVTVVLFSSLTESTREKRGQPIRCYTGQSIKGDNINQGSLTLTTCVPGAECSTTELTMTMSVAGISITADSTVGQCVQQEVCSHVTCKQIENTLRGMVSSFAVTFDDCSTSCCDEDKCNEPKDVTETAGNTGLVPVAGTQPPMRCYTGQMFSSPNVNRGSLTLTNCDPGSACSTTKIAMSMSFARMSQEGDTIVGQCVSQQNCQALTCNQIQSNLRSIFTSSSVTFGSCSTSCCQGDRCNDPSSGQQETTHNATEAVVVPAVGSACNPPLWHAETRDNAPVIGNPKFQLIVKKAKKGYRPGKRYKVFIKLAKKTRERFNGFMITLHHEEGGCNCPGQNCELGAMIGSRVRIAGAPVVQPGCDQPLVMDYPARSSKKVQAEWRAPPCGNVVMRAIVRGTDGRLYQDNDEDEPNRKLLTKVLRPFKRKPKKGRKRNKN